MSLVGFEPNAIRLVAKQLTNGQCRLEPKASGKLGFYTFLYVISGDS